jgi:hypothetical protein
MQMTYGVVTVFVDEFVYCNIIRMKLRAGVIPTYYVLTSWREREREEGREREREGERERDIHHIH